MRKINTEDLIVFRKTSPTVYSEPSNYDDNIQLCDFSETTNEEAVKILRNDGFDAKLIIDQHKNILVLINL